MRYAAITPASAIRRRAGRNPGGWWPRLNGTRASFAPASALSSPTWRGHPSGSWPSTTIAAPASSTSRGKGRDQVDPAVMPHLRRQRRPPSTSCTRLQSGQLHADAGDVEDGGAVVADQLAREADQNRREGRQPR